MATKGVLQSGWLLSRSKYLKLWKWRWVALTQESLIVCKREGVAHAKRSIPLTVASNVKVRSADTDTCKSHSFCLQTDGVVHFLVAASSDEKQSWLESISRFAAGSSEETLPRSRCSSGDSSSKSSATTTFSSGITSSAPSSLAPSSARSLAPSSARSFASSSASRWSERYVASKASGPSPAAPIAGEDAKRTGIEVLADVERALAAAEVPDAKVATAIARVLECAEELSERCRAAKALGSLASSSPVVAAAALPFALVTEKSPIVQVAVALAIGAAGEAAMGSSGRSALKRAAGDANAWVRAAAEEALWMSGWLEAVE